MTENAYLSQILTTRKIKRSIHLLLLLLLLCSSRTVVGAVFDHLVKAEGKDSNHSMRNIDFIYVLNLDHRPEKFKMCTDQLNAYDIYPYRFSAIYGKDLPIEVINDVGVKCQPGMNTNLMATYYYADKDGNIRHEHEKFGQKGKSYFCHCMGLGPVAIALSHLSILKDAYDSGYQTVWIMEDDVQLIGNPRRLSKKIAQLDALTKKKWDILFTDQDTKNQRGDYVPCRGFAQRPDFTPKDPDKFAKRLKIGKNFMKVGARYGAYSFIIRRSGIKKILDFYATHNIFLPYDMENILPADIELYTVVEDIVSTIPNALSDNN